MLNAGFFKTTTGRPTEFGTIFPPDLEWLRDQPEEPVVAATLPVVDAHHHLWQQPFAYRVPDYLQDTATGHLVTASVHVDCHSGYRTDGPDALRPVGETENVVALTSHLAAAQGTTQVAAGIVGFADLRLGAEVAKALEAHLEAGRGRFRGIRFSTGWDGSDEVQNTQNGERPGLLRDPQVRAGARALANLDLTLDAWLFHTQMSEVADLAAAVPDLTIVLNHCGGPLGYGPYAEDRRTHFEIWRQGLRLVARHPNVVCKLSGLLARGAAYNYLATAPPPRSDVLAETWRPWLTECIEAFGAARCMFGSNFPVDKMGTGFRTLWNAYKKVAAAGSSAEQEELFSGTARRAYRLAS